MLIYRIRLFMLFILLLAVNWAVLLWIERGATTAHAQSQPVQAAQVAVAVPPTFSYQGTLRLADGSLANGQFKLTIKLYNDALNGSLLYSETFDPVAVSDGLFSIVIGDQPNNALNPAIFSNPNIFLGVTIGNDAELLPRQRLHPVPLAMQASTATVANSLAPDAWKLNATRYIGNSRLGVPQVADYIVDLKRFVVEAKDPGVTPYSSVDVNEFDLAQLCADEDGCEMRLGMRDREVNQAGSNLLSMSFPYHFSLGNITNNQRLWHSVGFNDAGAGVVLEGVDGGNGAQSPLTTGGCSLTDGFVLDGVDRQDAAPGFTLLNVPGKFDSPNMVCVLVVND